MVTACTAGGVASLALPHDTHSMTTHDIVGKLWNLCNVLKDDGVTYHQYVTELTYMLFLKMAKETGTENHIPAGYRWEDLEAQSAPDRLTFAILRNSMYVSSVTYWW